ncbi:MAG: membrane protein insertase YidC [Deltaproteobacteria bacterium]|jgi:YidC/Oxa1 family membrane protein insertase|nr:membrane protein insertase YidC [Deltaproteobacteria bacterium]
MEKRLILTMVAMIAFFVLVSWLYPVIFPPPPVPESQLETAGTGDGQARLTATGDAMLGGVPAGPSVGADGAMEPSAVPAAPVVDPNPPREVTVETPEIVAVFTERGARLVSLSLKKYPATKMHGDDPDVPQELVRATEAGDLPLAMRIFSVDQRTFELANLRFEADQAGLEVAPGGVGRIVFKGETSGGLVFERIFTFTAGSYYVGQTVRVSNNSTEYAFGERLEMTLEAAPFARRAGRYDNVVGLFGGKLMTASAAKAQGEIADLGQPVSPRWLGYMSQYFLTAMILSGDPDLGAQDPLGLRMQASDRGAGGVQLVASWPFHINPGEAAAYDFSLYYGPKETRALDQAGHDLDRSIDLGWFGFLAKPLAWLLRMFYGLVGNYGVAIIIVTVLIKIALAPLTAKSYKSMKQMQKLQPIMAELREKYNDDRQQLNKEMMQLYKTYKVNPMGGCLPMLLQIPFFIAFYRVLDYALELRGAPFMLWIQDLSAPDRLFDFGMTIPFLDPPTGIPVMTIIMAGSMILQQKMTPTMGDPMQAKIMMLMPLFFSVILLNMPAGLVLYWLVNNILSIVQQRFINKSDSSASTGAMASKLIKGGKK